MANRTESGMKREFAMMMKAQAECGICIGQMRRGFTGGDQSVAGRPRSPGTQHQEKASMSTAIIFDAPLGSSYARNTHDRGGSNPRVGPLENPRGNSPKLNRKERRNQYRRPNQPAHGPPTNKRQFTPMGQAPASGIFETHSRFAVLEDYEEPNLNQGHETAEGIMGLQQPEEALPRIKTNAGTNQRSPVQSEAGNHRNTRGAETSRQVQFKNQGPTQVDFYEGYQTVYPRGRQATSRGGPQPGGGVDTRLPIMEFIICPIVAVTNVTPQFSQLGFIIKS
nr:putative PHD zinc finger protein [Ipomoea batatas]